MRKINLKIFTFTIFAISLLKNGFSSEEDIKRLEQLSSECSKNLRASLVGGRTSEIRQKFEEDFKEIKKICSKIQTDINKYNLGISLIHDSNFISQSYDKIKKMKQFAPEHYLFNDIEFVFS
ncbi:MAG TPA: hypothetical protein P5239_03830 [Victivallales bacterium]|nr:hypothetical protein [Victivallales bacterium]